MTNSRASGTAGLLGAVNTGTGNDEYFIPPNSASVLGSTTITNAQVTITNAIVVIRVRAVVIFNDKNVTATHAFMDDGVDVGTPLSITNATTGHFDSGATAINVAAGSKITFNWDTSASASGTLTSAIYCEYT